MAPHSLGPLPAARHTRVNTAPPGHVSTPPSFRPAAGGAETAAPDWPARAWGKGRGFTRGSAQAREEPPFHLLLLPTGVKKRGRGRGTRASRVTSPRPEGGPAYLAGRAVSKRARVTRVRGCLHGRLNGGVGLWERGGVGPPQAPRLARGGRQHNTPHLLLLGCHFVSNLSLYFPSLVATEFPSFLFFFFPPFLFYLPSFLPSFFPFLSFFFPSFLLFYLPSFIPPFRSFLFFFLPSVVCSFLPFLSLSSLPPFLCSLSSPPSFSSPPPPTPPHLLRCLLPSHRGPCRKLGRHKTPASFGGIFFLKGGGVISPPPLPGWGPLLPGFAQRRREEEEEEEEERLAHTRQKNIYQDLCSQEEPSRNIQAQGRPAVKIPAFPPNTKPTVSTSGHEAGEKSISWTWSVGRREDPELTKTEQESPLCSSLSFKD